MSKDIEKKVDNYYSKKIKDHGATSQGVDWNGEASHYLRFEQLCKVFKDNHKMSILDFGCGYGSLIDFLKTTQFQDYTYFGYDISTEMLNAANQKFSAEHIQFTNDVNSLEKIDYTIANGIFNVKLDVDDQEWEVYIKDTLKTIDKKTAHGFAFNILTSFSDEEYKKEYLYYANPMLFFEYCKQNFSKNVALLHDYELYEFTIIVRKD